MGPHGAMIGRPVSVRHSGQQIGVRPDGQRAGSGDVADLANNIGSRLGKTDDQHTLAAETLVVPVLAGMHDLTGEVLEPFDAPVRGLERSGAHRHSVEWFLGIDTVTAHRHHPAIRNPLDSGDFAAESDALAQTEAIGIRVEVVEVFAP